MLVAKRPASSRPWASNFMPNYKPMEPLARALEPDVAMLGVRGKVLENGMPRFFRRLAEGVFDTEDVRFRANELDGLSRRLLHAADRRGLFEWREYCRGPAAAAAEALSGAAPFRPMVPLEPQRLPGLSAKRVFIAAGRQDPIVPPSRPERLARLLRDAGADVTLHWSAAGHQISTEDVEAARAWFTRPATAAPAG